MKTQKNATIGAIFAILTVLGLVFTGCKQPSDSGTTTVPVTGVTLDKEEITLFEEGTYTLTATVEPSNATNKSVTWESDDEDVATVSDSGEVTAVATGTATITVITEDSDKTATCVVTVQAVSSGNKAVTGVTLNLTSVTLAVGDTQPLTATIAPTDATNKNVSWRSSNESIAKVNATDTTATITAVAPGNAAIVVVATDGSFLAFCNITVTPVPVSIEVAGQPVKTVYKIGETLDIAGLKVTANYDNALSIIINDIAIEHITGFDNTKVGEQTLTITYGAHQTTFKVKILANFTVVFDSNGGSTVSTQTVAEGETVTKPVNPIKTGTIVNFFEGWYNETFEKAFDFNTPITNNITLYAKWDFQYKLGDIGPGDGKIFYKSEAGFTMTDTNETCYYLEAAPTDMTTTLA